MHQHQPQNRNTLAPGNPGQAAENKKSKSAKTPPEDETELAKAFYAQTGLCPERSRHRQVFNQWKKQRRKDALMALQAIQTTLFNMKNPPGEEDLPF